MLDLFVDFATVVNVLGVPAYLFLLLAERRLGLPLPLTIVLTVFCIFGAMNHGFQAYALYMVDPFEWKDLDQDDYIALVWVTCMILKSLTLNVLAAAAWVYGAELRERAKKIQRHSQQIEKDDGR